MLKIVSSADSRADDLLAQQSVSGRELMRRAAEALFKAAEWKPPVAVVCGFGNNAGDGYALAEILSDSGVECRLFLLGDKFSDDGRYYFERCQKKGVPCQPCGKDTTFFEYPVVVDCIFGTGFHGEVEEPVKSVIRNINASGAYVLSADINSGLKDNGLGFCVQSDLTVSIGSYKPAHFLNSAKDVIKRKINADIGIPAHSVNCWLWEAEDCRGCLPPRKNFSNKGTYGYVALIGGSAEYSGAAKLANMACSAMLAGAGVVKLACPQSIAAGVMPFLLESTLFPLDDERGRIKFNENQIQNLISNVKVVALGMGLGVSEHIKSIIGYLALNFRGTLIIDADGLNCLAEMGADALKGARCRVVLTPHAGECARLSGTDIGGVLEDPVRAARSVAEKYGAITLLKGPSTVVTDGEKVFITDRGCAGMATAGSGDVLSGICAGVCASAGGTPQAVVTAAYINGLAGEFAQSDINAVSMLAGDTVKRIGEAVSAILGGV